MPSKWPRLRNLSALLGMTLLLAANGIIPVQATATPRPWSYWLVHDSYLLDDCPVCDRISVPVPMRGAFDLRLLGQTPISSRYSVENISFTAGTTPGYTVKGGGTLEIGGEVVVTVKMFLQLEIDDGLTNQVCYFTNATVTLDRLWPMMDITVGQTNGTMIRVYSLRLAAAPLRDIWFSPAAAFTATSGPVASNLVQAGDLISASGGVVRRNSQLYTSVGAMPPGPDLGLDALDVLPGGEIAFSLGADIFSATLGPLHHGDLLSTRGLVLRRNSELLAAFLPEPGTNDAGLDAAHVLDAGTVLFSISTNVFSQQLKAMLHRGDLLSSAGTLVRPYQDLLSHFHPLDPANDHGLDALYLWPSGEIWFSTEDGFQDQTLGAILPGDLLSDQGYLVFRNPELLGAFAPTNAPADIGLDALYIVTDATTPATPVRLDIAAQPSGGVTLTWQGQARVFQIERAGNAAGPYQPVTPILPDLVFEDPGTITNRSQSWYRLGQW